MGHLHLLYKIKPWDLSKNSPEISWNLTKEIKASFQNPSGVLQISRPWHLSTKSKPIGVGKKGVQGNYSLQNQGQSFPLTIPHLYRIKIWRYDIDEHVLLQNQEPAFCIWHLSTKSKPIGVGKKGFQGNYSLQNQGPSLSPSLTSTESRSEGMTLTSMFLLQNQRPSPKSVPYPKCKVLCNSSWGLGPLFYKSTESGTYQDRSKNDQNWWCLGGCQRMVLDSVARLGFKLALQNRRFLGPQPPWFWRGNCNQDIVYKVTGQVIYPVPWESLYIRPGNPRGRGIFGTAVLSAP